MVWPLPGMPEFVDSPKKILSPLKSEWGMGLGEVRGQEKGRVEDLGLVCKMKKIKYKNNTKKGIRLCLREKKMRENAVNRAMPSFAESVTVANLGGQGLHGNRLLSWFQNSEENFFLLYSKTVENGKPRDF